MQGERERGGELCVGVSHVCVCCGRRLLWLMKTYGSRGYCCGCQGAWQPKTLKSHLRQFVSSAASPAVADTSAKHTQILPRYALCCHWQQAWKMERRRGCYRYYRSRAQRSHLAAQPRHWQISNNLILSLFALDYLWRASSALIKRTKWVKTVARTESYDGKEQGALWREVAGGVYREVLMKELE